MTLRPNAVLWAAMAASIFGCDPPIDPLPTDVPRRDGGMRDVPGLDVPGLDVPGLDAPPPDVLGLDVPGLDAPLPDAPNDVGPDPDVPLATLDAPGCGSDVCACSTHADPCGAGGTCPLPQEICISDGCLMVCLPRGAPCVSGMDCAPGTNCRNDGRGGLACSDPTPGCTDSRDCARGFACVAGACSDRRIGCGETGACPMNFICDSSLGPPHCVRVLRGCNESAACPIAGVCNDVDGDGDRECVGPGVCDSNADCSMGMTCTTAPVETLAACGNYGPCRTAADCLAGQLCQDLWGDGVTECVDAGGTCSRIDDCPGTAICGTPDGGGPPTCLARSFPL